VSPFGIVIPSAGDRRLLTTLLPNQTEVDSISLRVAPGKQLKLETGVPQGIHVCGCLQDPGDDVINDSDKEDDDV
jgi:hypothetical protein